MSNQQFYDDNDAEEILRLASRDAVAGGMSRERLMQTAAELGITPEAVARAEKQLTTKREADRIQLEEVELRKQFRKERRRSFFNDLGSYLGVNTFMIGIWLFTSGIHSYFWPGWVLGGWGIGLVSDFWDTFVAGDDEKKFQRWLKRRNRTMGSSDIMLRATPILDEFFATHHPDEKLNAIKELRDRLNLDLRDAKDAVDQYSVDRKPGLATEPNLGPNLGSRRDVE